MLRPNVWQIRTSLVIQCKYVNTVQTNKKLLGANASHQTKQTIKQILDVNNLCTAASFVRKFIPVQWNVQNQLVYTVYMCQHSTIPPPASMRAVEKAFLLRIAWNSYNTVYYVLCTFFLEQFTSMYLLTTYFARTGCISMRGAGCQVCTVGSKDPNHQYVHIALILCSEQLHCNGGGGSKDPNRQCIHIYSTHFAWTSCTTRTYCAHTLLGPVALLGGGGSKDPNLPYIHIYSTHFAWTSYSGAILH